MARRPRGIIGAKCRIPQKNMHGWRHGGIPHTTPHTQPKLQNRGRHVAVLVAQRHDGLGFVLEGAQKA